jgi:acetylornithine deacetylase/succinyl-diaminopimelate desuccinylase-like protein
MADWENYLKNHKSRFLDEMLDFIRIPSISALSEHAGDVRRAAEWVADRMKAADIEDVRILPTDGPPVVYGEWLHAPGKPTILIYGHFDTQPVDPVDLWSHPPFEPVVRDGRVYARGASDDKGNMLIPIIAAEAMLKVEGHLPVNLKFFFEGEEEIGSGHLPTFIDEHRELLACDLVVSADGLQWREDQPALLVGFKGLCALQIDVEGANVDLHSGIYGGTVQNPIHALVRLLDSMRSPDGRILVEGFHDGVIPLTDADRAHIAAIPHDEAEYKQQLGVDDVFGEPGYTTLERAWGRPTLEANGIWGGFQGEGTKTVIPREVHAKITCRLVPDQEPSKIFERIAAHIAKYAPLGVKIMASPQSAPSPAYRIPDDHPGNQAAYAVLEEVYGKAPYYTRLGGTLPVCSFFLDKLDVYTVVFAFALEDENAHAPDEFFRLISFERGQKAYCKLLQRLSQQDRL